jgi:hypothetical protein
MRFFSLTILVFLATACGEDAGLSGVWTGISTGGIGVSLTLVETPQGVVSGAGKVISGLNTLPVNATGAHAHPSLSLTLDFPRINFSPISYQGVLNTSMTAVRGALNGSGLSGDSLVLNRSTPAASARITGP